jgi:pimeloyl-ACP methyl ester carboxylesterase
MAGGTVGRLSPTAASSTLQKVPTFLYHGHRLDYSQHGSGDRPVVLLHGLLLSQRMHLPLARDLAERGNRVICLDLLGHGASDRPRDMWRYSMTFFGEQVIALLDELGMEQAVVMGTSLGANATLEVASLAPERLRGMVIEMPVLDNALLACALAFTPLLVSLTFGEPVMRLVQRAAQAIPEARVPWFANVVLDAIRQDPAPGAAILQGLFFGRIAPHRTERRTFEAPALVIGHRRDPVHPFSDAGMLADELPHGRLLEAESIVELRFSPDRLTNEIAAFIDECWLPQVRDGRRRRAAG